jgi:sugar-specific transcriptional regulator TrmB
MEIEHIFKVLESTGLTRNEIIIYLALIKLRKSSALELSKETKIHRPNVYDLLEKLLKKGIIDQSNENGKKFFYPISPSDLLDYLKQKEQELEEIIPEIEKIESLPEESERVSLSKGKNSIKNILTHTIDLKEPIYFFGIKLKNIEKIKGYYEPLNRLRIQRKIPLKIILKNILQKQLQKLKK